MHFLVAGIVWIRFKIIGWANPKNSGPRPRVGTTSIPNVLLILRNNIEWQSDAFDATKWDEISLLAEIMKLRKNKQFFFCYQLFN